MIFKSVLNKLVNSRMKCGYEIKKKYAEYFSELVRFCEIGCVSLLFAFFSIASADESNPSQQVIPGEGTVGVLRTIGAYKAGTSRHGSSFTLLPNGNVFVYGPTPLNYGNFAAIRWDAKERAWQNVIESPECQYTRFAQTATVLANNRILFGGGTCYEPLLGNHEGPLPPAFNKLSIWNDNAQRWETTPPLKVARRFHNATLLANGGVLFTGGSRVTAISGEVGEVLDSVELLQDANSASPAGVAQLPHLHYPREKHSATQLTDGRVMVVGGIGVEGKAVTSVEIWDSVSQQWQDGPSLITPRYNHSVFLLSDGRVMVVGGLSTSGEPLSSVEVWEPARGTWEEGDPLLWPLRTVASTVLGNGDVLVVGTGFNELGYTNSRIMLWQQSTAKWKVAGKLSPDDIGDIRNPENYTLHRRQNGNVLVFGNSVILQWSPVANGAGEYLPDSGRTGFASALLKNGRILLAGGRVAGSAIDLAEIYDPVNSTITMTGRMKQPRMIGMPFQDALSSVVTNDGRVVIAGGWVKPPLKNSTSIANYAEVWDPATGQWSINKELYFEAEERVYLGKLDDGRVLFFSSREFGEDGALKYRSLIWDPVRNTVISRPVTAKPRANAAISILMDGRVLIAGGVWKEFVPEYRCQPVSRSAWRGKNTDSPDEDEGCRGEPAFWRSIENGTAEIWDSRTGQARPIVYPPNWRASVPQTLLLRNGDVILVNSVMSYPMRIESPQPIWLFHAQNETWSQLPPIEADMSWPMTEASDGSLIAWAPESINPTHAKRLKPGSASWERLPRFPQNKAKVSLLPSGQLLALSSAEPYSAVLDEQSQQWQLKHGYYVATENPALVELPDGRVAVLGTILTRKIIAQIWNPKRNTWSSTGKIVDGRSTGKAVRLPSGRVLHIGYGEIGTYICEIWQPADDSWSFCGSIKSTQKNSYPEFIVGSLNDGRAVFMGSTDRTHVFDETTNAWVEMQVEWNRSFYSLGGVAMSSNKSFARFLDPKKNEWVDASIAAGKYYSMPRNSGNSTYAMLWNPKRKHWAYINYEKMGRNGFWLPDGCAITGPPFKIFNPTTEAVTEHPVLSFAWMKPESMTVLLDGTIVVAGSDATGRQFFHRKASCSGIVALPEDIDLIPANNAVVAMPENAKSRLVDSASVSWGARIGGWDRELKGIGLALLVPLVLYFIIRSLLGWFRKNKRG